ncbi:reverse transcriptase domain-containing protein [Paenibacillus sp. JX-17]|uniref:Reverse transcriptase domain-containing protein n=1 Tax=Paenibacillus lacisoli TaxID=3064525 RepID=A0ABT9CI31_9BACL|nr:reverse transcriptase domain-containing protein [Paenibacillus sp. JX-17]MDO7908866.1 reverse transcriptase domain-containing protein [Paenibacillus sp. JX-17]
MDSSRYIIPRKVIWKAFQQSRKTKVIGVDGQTIQDFKRNHKTLLSEQHQLLTSGKYKPSPVRRVFIPKRKGGLRAVGIPTVKDFIVQTVLKNELYLGFEVLFHPNSYGYKQKREAREEAIHLAGKRCLQQDWLIVLDIRNFGDNINHRLLMNMLKKDVRKKWVLLYTQRTMKAPEQTRKGKLIPKKKGLAQGNKLNFLLGNYYLHHIFDMWMQKNHPHIVFERYTDDIICHCKSEATAQTLLKKIKQRLKMYHLTPHPQKTKIVYCKDAKRKENYSNVSFEFLGAKFQSRKVKTQNGKFIIRFAPSE